MQYLIQQKYNEQMQGVSNSSENKHGKLSINKLQKFEIMTDHTIP